MIYSEHQTNETFFLTAKLQMGVMIYIESLKVLIGNVQIMGWSFYQKDLRNLSSRKTVTAIEEKLRKKWFFWLTKCIFCRTSVIQKKLRKL